MSPRRILATDFQKRPRHASPKAEFEASGWKEGAAIRVNPGYLHDAIRFVASDDLTIGITGEEHPVIIEAGSFYACVMPVRLEKGGENESR
jgi:hypothetical protein